jgi:inorganic pyrophosphatase
MRAPLQGPAAMALDLVPAGRDLPNDFNVVIEIPMNSEPVKY